MVCPVYNTYTFRRWIWGESRNKRIRSSSVSIVSDYGLDYRAIGVRSPVGVKDFSSNLCVQTGSEANPAFCTMGTGGPFPGAKRGRGVTLTTHTCIECRGQEWVGAIPPLPPSAFVACFDFASNKYRDTIASLGLYLCLYTQQIIII
jgi:hypothetical protein